MYIYRLLFSDWTREGKLTLGVVKTPLSTKRWSNTAMWMQRDITESVHSLSSHTHPFPAVVVNPPPLWWFAHKHHHHTPRTRSNQPLYPADAGNSRNAVGLDGGWRANTGSDPEAARNTLTSIIHFLVECRYQLHLQ